MICEIGGMVVAHSIVLEGFAFACLSQCMFQYQSNVECYPELEDIPLNITTHDKIHWRDNFDVTC